MRIYMYGTGTPENIKTNEALLNIVSETNKAKEELDEKDYGNWVVALHNHMREKMELPNKIFAIVRDKEDKNVHLIFFDKEPDGKHYEVSIEEREDGFVPYIEVEV